MKALLVLASLSILGISAVTWPAQAMTDRHALKALVTSTITTKVSYCRVGYRWSSGQHACVHY
jgi:hypothetical protein